MTDKDKTAAHLAAMFGKTVETAGRSTLKLFDDARHAGCEREFGLALKSLGLEDDATHYLGAARMKKLS